MAGWTALHVDDVEPGGRGNAVRFMRRELGVEAFGINWFEIPPGVTPPLHDEIDSGQEEVVVVVGGRGVWRVDGEEVEVRRGSFLRFDPHVRRAPRAGPDGLTFVAVGSRPGAYEPRGPF